MLTSLVRFLENKAVKRFFFVCEKKTRNSCNFFYHDKNTTIIKKYFVWITKVGKSMTKFRSNENHSLEIWWEPRANFTPFTTILMNGFDGFGWMIHQFLQHQTKFYVNRIKKLKQIQQKHKRGWQSVTYLLTNADKPFNIALTLFFYRFPFIKNAVNSCFVQIVRAACKRFYSTAYNYNVELCTDDFCILCCRLWTKKVEGCFHPLWIKYLCLSEWFLCALCTLCCVAFQTSSKFIDCSKRQKFSTTKQQYSKNCYKNECTYYSVKIIIVMVFF